MIRNVPLSVMYPKLCEEWSDKNLPLTPDQFSYSSHDVAWWKGSCGHEWQASIYRTIADRIWTLKGLFAEACDSDIGGSLYQGIEDSQIRVYVYRS